MPLDTQPLTRTRRMTMLAVLAALFVGSLGYAEFLVMKHPGDFDVVPVLEKVGFTVVEPPTLPSEIAARTGMVEKRERLVEVFTWESPRELTPREQKTTASAFYQELTTDQPVIVEKGELLGRSGFQASGKDDQDEFTMLRLAVIDRHVVAISYSGLLPYTDADKTTFNAICATGVELRK